MLPIATLSPVPGTPIFSEWNFQFSNAGQFPKSHRAEVQGAWGGLEGRNFPAFPCSFYSLSDQVSQPFQHLSNSISLSTPRPGQAKPGNRASLPGWPSLLVLAEWLKTSVACRRAHLQSLAHSPLSAPRAQAVKFHRPLEIFIFALHRHCSLLELHSRSHKGQGVAKAENVQDRGPEFHPGNEER